MSEYTDFERLIDNARVRLPGALDGVIKLELHTVLREFTTRSNVWREDIPLSMAACARTASLVPTAEADIVRLLYASSGCGDRKIPLAAYFAPPDTLVVREGALGSGTGPVSVTAMVALTVPVGVRSDGVPAFPTWIADKYFDALLDGVLSRMMAQAAKPYSSVKGVQFHGMNFRAAISKAKNEANKHYVQGGQSWRYPQQFATARRSFS